MIDRNFINFFFQTRRITELFTGPSRIVEIKALLEKEIQLLNGIELRRLEIQKEMQQARHDRILQKTSETTKWIGYKSETTLNSLSPSRCFHYCLFKTR